MPDYLIFKQKDDGTWAPTTAASGTSPEVAVKQGYTGPGRYAAVDWSARVEVKMSPGPVTVELAKGAVDATIPTLSVRL